MISQVELEDILLVTINSRKMKRQGCDSVSLINYVESFQLPDEFVRETLDRLVKGEHLFCNAYAGKKTYSVNVQYISSL